MVTSRESFRNDFPEGVYLLYGESRLHHLHSMNQFLREGGREGRKGRGREIWNLSEGTVMIWRVGAGELRVRRVDS